MKDLGQMASVPDCFLRYAPGKRLGIYASCDYTALESFPPEQIRITQLFGSFRAFLDPALSEKSQHDKGRN
jgi:hypothetical protein